MTFGEHPQRATPETDLTYKKTKTNTMTNTKTKTMIKTFREHPQRTVQETCDLKLDTCDTDFISDN